MTYDIQGYRRPIDPSISPHLPLRKKTPQGGVLGSLYHFRNTEENIETVHDKNDNIISFELLELRFL